MISSQLQSQLFSKLATKWILIRKGLVWSESDPWLDQHLKIQVFEKCVLVSLPKNPNGNKGFSLFISMWEYLDYFTNRSTTKAEDIECLSMSGIYWLVESYQKQDKYTVALHPEKIKCDCMLFRCLQNRIKSECPYFYSLMRLDDFFAGNVVCHHVYRVLNELGFWDLASYLNRQRQTA